MRIAFVIPSLSRDGGVERIASLVANGLSEQGHDVCVITRTPSTYDHQPLSASVGQMQLYVPRGRKLVRNTQLPLVVGSLARCIRRFGADVVIGARWDCAILSLLAALPQGVPVVAWEHVYLPLATLSAPWKALRRLTYPRAAALVLVNAASIEYAERLIDPSRVHVIRNFVAEDGPEEGGEPSKWNDFVGGPPEHKLLALGRLEHQKGFDMLIDAYAPIADDHPDWGLMIVGRGSTEEALRTAIDRRGLHPRVQLVGPVTDPQATYRDSDLFVFPSRYEGFPLTLVEAMRAGLPVVAFDCGGPDEIVTHEEDGLLVPPTDTAALGRALARMMQDPDRRAAFAAKARVNTQWLTRSDAMGSWAGLLDGIRPG